MTFFTEERAVSPVLGGILMFGLAVSLLILTQVSVVPVSNQQVEFEHNQGVQKDFERFQGSTTRVAASGATETVDIELGTRYPNRFFLVNPAPASGTLTAEDAKITLENVNATNPETDEYFVSVGNALEYETKRVLYEPNYNQYTNAPRTVHENGVTFNEFDGDVTLVTSATPLVNDGDITLILLDGDLDEQGTDSASLTLQAASAPSQRIAITNNGTDPITITLDTRLPESEWEAFNASTTNVTRVKYTGDQVTITLDTSRDYTLRVARLSIGDSPAPQSRAYVTSVGTPVSSTPSQSSVTYTVEVRDRYNNPVSGESMVASVSDGAQFSDGSGGVIEEIQNSTTDEDGRWSVTVVGNENENETVTIRMGIPASGTSSINVADGPSYAEYELEFAPTVIKPVTETADVGAAINPNGIAGDLVLRYTYPYSNGTGNDVEKGAVLLFENTADDDRIIKTVRVNFVKADGQGINPKIPTIEAASIIGTKVHSEVTGGDFDDTTTQLTVGGDYKTLNNSPITVPAENYLTLRLAFAEDSTTLPNGDYAASPGDFFIISVTFKDGTATYFAGVVPEAN